MGDTERQTRVTITEQPSFVAQRSWHPWGDGYLVPDHFSARVEGDWLPGVIELAIVANVRGVRCTRVSVRAREGQTIGSRELRDVPLKECVRMATATIARRGEKGRVFSIDLGSDDDPAVALTLASRRPHRRVEDEWLREAASIYTNAEALGEPPTKAVQEQHSRRPFEYKTAARWVELARRRTDSATGKTFLPPVKRTKER